MYHQVVWDHRSTTSFEPVWRVEAFDDDGVCHLTVFHGPDSERRAKDYAEAMNARLAPRAALIDDLVFSCDTTDA
jgi:hypothetical protein